MSRLLAAMLLLSVLSIAHVQNGVRIALHATGSAVKYHKVICEDQDVPRIRA